MPIRSQGDPPPRKKKKRPRTKFERMRSMRIGDPLTKEDLERRKKTRPQQPPPMTLSLEPKDVDYLLDALEVRIITNPDEMNGNERHERCLLLAWMTMRRELHRKHQKSGDDR